MSQATTLEVQAREMPCSNLPVCGAGAAAVGRPRGMRCWLLQQGWGCCMWRAACSRWTVCLWCWRCLRCPCIRALRLIHLHLQTITRPSSIRLTMGQTHRNQVNNKAIKHLSYNGTNTQEPSVLKHSTPTSMFRQQGHQASVLQRDKHTGTKCPQA